MIIENLDFNNSSTVEGSSDILQYVPELPAEEIKPPQIQMDFSTPISDVVPSADFAPSGGEGSYINPTNDRVAGLSLVDTEPAKAPKKKNPFGLTDDQLYAAIAGVAAVVGFSKPVQSKLSSFIPKFQLNSGDLSLTGMIASALVVAVVYFMLKRLV
jgi:hypothetical protein